MADDARARWIEGYGRIRHTAGTRRRVEIMADELARTGVRGDGVSVYEALLAADRIASAAMWLVVHETYARTVHVDGRPLGQDDFKPDPEGHTGGALNMVPAYVGGLAARSVPHTVVYMLEPGRFRAPRSEREARRLAPPDVIADLYPSAVDARVFVSHTRAEPLIGTLRPLHTGARTVALGFMNHGGTLSVDGMLFVNRQTWAHCLDAVATLVGESREAFLSTEEIAAVDHRRSPHGVVIGGLG